MLNSDDDSGEIKDKKISPERKSVGRYEREYIML
jgi:hypothetical protein